MVDVDVPVLGVSIDGDKVTRLMVGICRLTYGNLETPLSTERLRGLLFSD